MTTRRSICKIVLVCIVVVVALVSQRQPNMVLYGQARSNSQTPSSNPSVSDTAEPILQALNYRQQEPQPAPPPPPPPLGLGSQPTSQHPSEPRRTLVGMTKDELTEFERFLPDGARVYLYPVGKDQRAAALISRDLDGDGSDETVVVYNERKPTREEGSLPLILSIMKREGNKLVIRSTVRLVGGVFFSPRIEGVGASLSACDLIGDGHPEIVVVSGGGASVGGALQAFSFDGSTLRELARIGGHFFRVQAKRAGKPGLITARWNREEGARTYEWNGKEFEETAQRVKKSQ